MKLKSTTKKKKIRNTTNTWRLKNILLKNAWVSQEIKEEKKNTWQQMKMKKHGSPKPLLCIKSGPKGEVYSNTGPTLGGKKNLKNLTSHLKGSSKRRTNEA